MVAFMFMGRDIETLTKEELMQALKWCCKRINELDTPEDVRMRILNRRNVNAQLFTAKPIVPPKDVFTADHTKKEAIEVQNINTEGVYIDPLDKA